MRQALLGRISLSIPSATNLHWAHRKEQKLNISFVLQLSILRSMQNSGPFGHFGFANHHFNWQILIKVWTSVIGLSCLIRTILEYEKVRQIWTLLLGYLALHPSIEKSRSMAFRRKRKRSTSTYPRCLTHSWMIMIPVTKRRH